MPDITITEYADALRREVDAHLRVHRVEVEAALRDVETEVRDGRREQRDQHRVLVALVADLAETVNGQASTVNELAATRATWTRRAQLLVRAVTSTPGLIGTVSTIAGATAAAIALL